MRGRGGGGGNFVFILDASGSMGAKIQGRIKMDVAKEALTGLVRELPAGRQRGPYGLRAPAERGLQRCGGTGSPGSAR